MSAFDKVLASLLILAIIAVIVSTGSKTSSVIGDTFSALTSAVTLIMTPLMAGA